MTDSQEVLQRDFPPLFEQTQRAERDTRAGRQRRLLESSPDADSAQSIRKFPLQGDWCLQLNGVRFGLDHSRLIIEILSFIQIKVD
jgi:hypothetical protein